MLEGVQSVIGRIQQIESSFQSRSDGAGGSFQMAFQQAQSALAGANYTPFSGAMPGMAPGAQPFLNNVNPSLWGLVNPTQQITSGSGSTYNMAGSQLASMAEAMDGRQYWSNACAHAVNDVLKSVGIDVSDKTKSNPNWVPNYADLGLKVNAMNDLRPGDLVIYNNYLGEGGYDHIGIYAGNGEAWNVSTAAGHKWVKTPIGSRFQEGRRITAM